MDERTGVIAEIRPPALSPCGSCPYRKDVPSGVWAPEEYDKLPAYDGETWEQPTGVFLCHQQDGRVCAGWAGCHDMSQSLAVRLSATCGDIDEETTRVLLDYSCPVPLFASGAEAAAHGKAEVDAPGDQATKVVERLQQKQARRAVTAGS